MHDLAIISRIQSITPLEGKDKIVLARVENYNTIIDKDEFKEGDTIIYVFHDAILPVKEEYEFLRKRCWSERYQGFQIKPMLIGGVVSEGLVLPMSYLKGKDYTLGQDVSKELEIRDTDEEDLNLRFYLHCGTQKTGRLFNNKFIVKFLKKFEFASGILLRNNITVDYPKWIKKSDEVDIEKCYIDQLGKNLEYIITEKIEGMSVAYAIDRFNRFRIFSHNYEVLYGTQKIYADASNMERKLREYCNEKGLKGICIQGEFVGPGIRCNVYGNTCYDFYMFGGCHLNGTPLTWDELNDINALTKIKVVPYLGTSRMYDIDDMLRDSEGFSKVVDKHEKPIPREGVVWRTADGTNHFRVKARNYKVWFSERVK